MRITDIQVERYGVWRNLTMPLATTGLSLFYGPNEAGKTTLMRFVRGVLYGFSPRLADDGEITVSPAHLPSAGSLRVEEHGASYRLHRAAFGTSRGDLSLIGREPPPAIADEATIPDANEILQDLLKGTDERVFEHVFAVGLRELQELGTLTDDQVAHHIYGATLGPEGQRLLDACQRVQAERNLLVDALQQQGELVELFEQHDDITARLRSLDKLPEQHAELSARRDKLEDEIADLKRRQAGIQEQLRGHHFMERAWGPWNRLRECQTELHDLPVVTNFPEQGIERLDKLDGEIASTAEVRDTLLGEAKQLQQQAARRPLAPEIRKHGAAMQGFIGQRGWLADLQERIRAAGRVVEEAEFKLEASLEPLGAEWTANRLETVDTSAVAHHRLTGTARSFDAARARRGTIRRTCRRLAEACRRQRDVVAGHIKSLHGEPIADALTAARQKFDELKDLAQLRLHEAELLERQAGIDEHFARITPRLMLPKWVSLVLAVFCVSGAILGAWGLITGVTTSEVAGTIYALLGITCGGLAWGMKTQFESDAREHLSATVTASDENLAELRSTREKIRRATGEGPKPEVAEPSSFSGEPAASLAVADTEPVQTSPPASRLLAIVQSLTQHVWTFLATSTASTPLPVPRAPVPAPSALPTAPDVLRQAAERIVELEQAERDRQRLKQTRRKLAEWRGKLKIAHREVGTARESWRDLLAQIGLREPLEVDAAFDTWRKLVEAVECRRQGEVARAHRDQLRDLWNGYRQRIGELGRQMQAWDANYDEPLEVLAGWEEQLATFAKNRKARHELRDQIQAKRREAAEYQTLVDELKTHRGALLVQGGAAHRDEFEQRSHWAARRTFLEDQADDAERDLDLVLEGHANLALVEEDLVAYNARENGDCIEMLRLELDDLEQDMQRTFERLGSVKHELTLLEDDREGTELRYEREQVATKLRRAAEKWFAFETAAQTIDAMRRRFERTCQPLTLAEASRFLLRLTCGKYVNVWTPLDQRHLRVDDDRGDSLPVEALSRGTREQLFLAVRLAVVRDLARKGIVLPIILDDVIVNFDQRRAEAAVELLLEFAAQGHQVLFFTCHLHLAHLFESQGVEPNWLPGHQPLHERGEQRRAG